MGILDIAWSKHAVAKRPPDLKLSTFGRKAGRRLFSVTAMHVANAAKETCSCHARIARIQ
jgi:hypothetical protein